MAHSPSVREFTLGETIVLSGKFASARELDPATIWPSAIATITIYDTTTGMPAVADALVTIGGPDTDGDMTYLYTVIVTLPVLLYSYRIKVLYTDTTIVFFPRGSKLEKFRVVD